MTTPGAVRYEVLGPLRAWQSDRELDLGPAKQRAVLAVLLLNANRPARTDAIIDAVWRDDPPANGVNVVQKHVAGLRRVLEPERSPRSGGGVIALTDAGYVLSVDAGALDIDVVDRLANQARLRREQGLLAETAAILTEAIGQWRADALAGLHGPVFDAARGRFTETKASLVEAWVDVELDLGHEETVIPAVAAFVAEFPVRERLREQLMLALYRSGRQAEALAVYRDVHRFLDQEFGVNPGAALTTLHQRILRADPQLMRAETLEPVVGVAPATTPGSERPKREPQPFAPAVPHQPMSYVPVPPPVGYPAASHPVASDPAMFRSTDPAPKLHPVGIWEWIGVGTGLLVILGSVGFAAWLPIGVAAMFRRDRFMSWCTGGYLAMAGGMFVMALAPPEDSPYSIAAILLIILTALVAAGQLLISTVLRAVRSAPSHGMIQPQQIRRDQARQILAEHPAVARQLGIGRPDLPRKFDDGGLIDINAVPEQVFVLLLGLEPGHARQIVADRHARGVFRSVDDLVARGLLDPTSLRRHSDQLVAGPVAAVAA